MRVYLLFVLAAFFLISCDNDDSLPEIPDNVFNAFCYGPDNTEEFVDRAFAQNTVNTGPDIFKNDLFITGSGFQAPGGVIEGSGFAISLQLFGNRDISIQTGLYEIQDMGDVATARLTYIENYDSTQQLNQGVPLTSGTVLVRPYSTGYLIEINGDDANGSPFHGNYFGVLTTP